MSESSSQVCFVVIFLNKVGDGKLDCIVMFFFVSEVEILYRIHIREHQWGSVSENVRSISLVDEF